MTATAQTNYFAGQAGEESVARVYEGDGMRVAHRRWRGSGGEIDLIVRHGDEVVFVEVKKSKSFEQAALRLQPRQVQRLLTAAEEFLGNEPRGLLTDTRFDVALVNAVGQVKILENALMAV